MNRKGQELGTGILIFLLILGISIIVSIIGFDYVTAGTVGVKDDLGNVDPIPLQPGVYWTGMTTHTENMNTRVQLAQYDSSAASKDMQDVKTKVAVNFMIEPSRAPEIYRTIGINYANVIINPIVQEAVKASTAKYIAEELILERSIVKATITNEITNKLAQKGLIVTEVSITDFSFSPEFTAAIEKKQVAQQDALTAVNKLKEMESLSKAMELQTGVIEIRKLDLQKQWIEKWNGVMPTVMSGNDQNMLLGLDVMKK